MRRASIGRYICVYAPDCLWTVWDNKTNIPATFRGKHLVDLPFHRAEMVRDVLERTEEMARAQAPLPEK